VTSRAEQYRRYARQCLEIAPAFRDEEARATLLGLAQAWLRLTHLALANRQIAELAVQVARQREIVKHGFDTGQRSEMAEHSRSTGYFCSVASGLSSALRC